MSDQIKELLLTAFAKVPNLAILALALLAQGYQHAQEVARLETQLSANTFVSALAPCIQDKDCLDRMIGIFEARQELIKKGCE